jgi:hypothetical protein
MKRSRMASPSPSQKPAPLLCEFAAVKPNLFTSAYPREDEIISGDETMTPGLAET